MTTIAQIQMGMRQIATTRQQIAEAEDVLRAMKADLADLRVEILSDLKALDMVSMKTSDLSVVIKHKQDVKITNKEWIKAWLSNQPHVNPDEYLTVDTDRIKPLLKTAIIDDGEVIDGVELSESEVLQITEVKEKK